jgi:hypothetical protein
MSQKVSKIEAFRWLSIFKKIYFKDISTFIKNKLYDAHFHSNKTQANDN